MKKNQFIIRVMMALVLAFGTSLAADAQFGSLKNLGKKVTEKAADKVADKAKEETQKKVKKSTGVDINSGSVTDMASQAAYSSRGEAPWPMNDEETYKGMDMDQFVANITSIPEDELISLRDALFARYKSNLELIKKKGVSKSMVEKAENENKLFRILYNVCIFTEVSRVNCCVEFVNGEMRFFPDGFAHHMIVGPNGGGIGAFVFHEAADQQKFCDRNGNGIFLDEKDLNIAKDLRDRLHRYKVFSKGLYNLVPEEDLYGNDKDIDCKMRHIFSLAAMSANALDVAIEKNNPANIDRKARPASGSMEKSLKSQALAAAKAQNSKVIDVIIKSNSWDVKTKGGVPTHRSVYGYWLVKDDQGTKCMSRMWTQSYQGNGKYGNLRAGGAGLDPDFYIK